MMIRKLWLLAAMAACGIGSAGGAPLASPAEASDGRTLWGSDQERCRELPPAASTRLGVIRQMLVAGKPHAAIAYLDAARVEAPQADLLRADGLRHTGRADEAGRLYRKLLGSCVAGYAYQGLGLSASQAGRKQEAVAHLQAASAALPVDASVRNDYGYALMMTGENDTALHEFLTAIELAPNQRRAAHNLLLLLSRSGDDAKAAVFAKNFGVSADELAGIRQLAREQLPGMTPPTLPLGMTDPLARDEPAAADTTQRNATGAHDETEKNLAGGMVAGSHDGQR